MKRIKIVITLFLIVSLSSCWKTKQHSQDIIADETRTQTNLTIEQNAQLKRIADILERHFNLTDITKEKKIDTSMIFLRDGRDVYIGN